MPLMTAAAAVGAAIIAGLGGLGAAAAPVAGAAAAAGPIATAGTAAAGLLGGGSLGGGSVAGGAGAGAAMNDPHASQGIENACAQMNNDAQRQVADFLNGIDDSQWPEELKIPHIVVE